MHKSEVQTYKIDGDGLQRHRPAQIQARLFLEPEKIEMTHAKSGLHKLFPSLLEIIATVSTITAWSLPNLDLKGNKFPQTAVFYNRFINFPSKFGCEWAALFLWLASQKIRRLLVVA